MGFTQKKLFESQIHSEQFLGGAIGVNSLLLVAPVGQSNQNDHGCHDHKG